MRRAMTSLLCAGAILMGSAGCSDDDDASDEEPPTTEEGTRTIASGTDIEIEGEGDGLPGQTLNILVEEEGGEVTGEFRITDVVNTVECIDTDTEGILILGGTVTDDAGMGFEGALNALVIRDRDPDGVFLYGNDVGATTCEELVDSIPEAELTADGAYNDLEPGSDIEID
jgi:hypothetical protein